MRLRFGACEDVGLRRSLEDAHCALGTLPSLLGVRPEEAEGQCAALTAVRAPSASIVQRRAPPGAEVPAECDGCLRNVVRAPSLPARCSTDTAGARLLRSPATRCPAVWRGASSLRSARRRASLGRQPAGMMKPRSARPCPRRWCGDVPRRMPNPCFRNRNGFVLSQTAIPQAAAFLEVDAASEAALAGLQCGTTALAALLLGSDLFVANAGDCCCVAGVRVGVRGASAHEMPGPLEAAASPRPAFRAEDLSADHRLDNASERGRAEAAGASVSGGGFLNGEVAVTRALGDWHMRSKRPAPGRAATALVAEPEVRRARVTEDVRFLILVRTLAPPHRAHPSSPWRPPSDPPKGLWRPSTLFTNAAARCAGERRAV